jgi:type I site-specific restriction endonuclease
VKPESIRVFTQETPLVTLVDQLKEHLNQGDDSRKKLDILVLTYRTFIAFIKKQSEQQKKLLATRYPLIIEDEAHRAV